MEKQIEKAIWETLVISNPQSIHLAVKKILLLLNDSVEFCEHEWINDSFDHFGFLTGQVCDKCGTKQSVP